MCRNFLTSAVTIVSIVNKENFSSRKSMSDISVYEFSQNLPKHDCSSSSESKTPSTDSEKAMGPRTGDTYTTLDLPERFQYPSKIHLNFCSCD